MQQQLEAYKADSAAQLKATEAQTLELLLARSLRRLNAGPMVALG